MASKSSTPKPYAFYCIIFMVAFTFFTFHYLKKLQDEFQNRANAAYHAKLSKNPEWFEVIAREIGHEHINVGLVNMEEESTNFRTKGVIIEVQFDAVQKNVQWSDLYPEWINESAPSNCPVLPMPEFENYRNLDVVVARLPPCTKCDPRDVFRLQVNSVVANLLVRSGRIGRPLFGVFIGSIEPMWGPFVCEDLLWNDGNFWVNRPQLTTLKQKVFMPIGSCQVAPLFRLPKQIPERREAYVTVLHSSEAYVCGAIVLAQSIIQSNSTKDLVLLADDHISPTSIDGLKSAGWKIRRIERIRSPHSKKDSYNEWNYSKLRIWQLTDYDKVIFIDSDLIVAGNLDELFAYPQISAAGNDGHLFNSGVMVIEPSECTFDALMEKRFTVGSYNGGDQGFLNEMFPWWHRISSKANRMKFFAADPSDRAHRMAEDAHAIHYLGLKPWLCYKDYDCNWDREEYRKFASDSANERWWRVYDRMPKELRRHCRLTRATEAGIQRNRRKARDGGYADGHWRIEIRDSRRSST